MQDVADIFERRTTTDVVFHQLQEDIVSLKLLPGTKLSEVEVARRFGVSRQPVRDAFNRLDNLDLLLIRPQKATEVRGFSIERIGHARFVRLAVELEVIRHACSVWNDSCAENLERNLEQQQRSIDMGETETFHVLDYRFHKMICELGGCPLAFETIQECKRKVDRLCVLSLERTNESATLLDDHRQLAQSLRQGAVERATAITRQHLSRLDDTIADIHRTHAEYFE
ncbi:MAG: GntR family transcriptional regulator [Geminicoccaceae bacterium]